MSEANGGDVVFAHPAPVNGDRTLVNGVTNGHSSSGGGGSSSSSHKHRSSSSSGGHHKSSSKDKHRSSSSKGHSSSSGNKVKTSSSSSSRDKDKDRTHVSSSSSSHKSSSRDKDRHRDKDGKQHSSSSSSSRDKDKERAERKEKERAERKEKERINGNGEKAQDSATRPAGSTVTSSSSSSRDKDKDRHHKTSSSSSKHKHSSSSSSSRSKHRSSNSSSSHRHSSSGKSSRADGATKDEQQQNEGGGVVAPVVVAAIKDEDDDVDVEDCVATPVIKQEMNVSQASSCDYSLSQFNANESQFVGVKREESDDDNDAEDDAAPPLNHSHANNTSIKRDLDHATDDAREAKRAKVEPDSEDEDDIPISARKKVKTEKVKSEKVKKAKKKKHESDDDDEDDDYEDTPKKKKIKKEKTKKAILTPPAPNKTVKRETAVKNEASPTKAGGRKKKAADEPEEVWKWWEEEKREDGVKWNFLEHKGPVFAPPYEPLPANVPFEYDGQPMKLSQDAEEIACFYAKMLNHDFTSKPVFNDNFFGDWRKAMTSREREKITKLKHCNFTKMFNHFTAISERNKSRTKDEKAALKTENEALLAEFGFCTIDGHKEKIGNFRIEPPGLFRGRGEHPKMGKIKRRVMPEDILINCSKNSKIPVPPAGHRWREVKHDNAVTWLASWTENVQGQVKYVMLNPSSKLKGEKDWQKYETARRLHKHIDKIRNTYRDEWKSKEMRIRQRGVALYFIDKLALRAGNEKDEDQADTVGCCSLRVEHIELHKSLNDKENVVVFDFLGKDSIRYYNEVEVEKRVFKNLELFKENKKEGDDLFDRLNTVVMNEHLRELMDGLTAKVFRTYNASWTLQCQLNEMTDAGSSLPEKLLAYNRANRAVAILCNHQRAVPKSHEKSMENLKEKIRVKREQLDDLEHEVKDATKAAKHGSVKEKMIADKKKKALQRTKEQLMKMELQETDRDENKTIALGTSKLNYLDPRISVAWCKKHDVPIEKIYNKTQRDKFRWAIDMATADYHF